MSDNQQLTPLKQCIKECDTINTIKLCRLLGVGQIGALPKSLAPSGELHLRVLNVLMFFMEQLHPQQWRDIGFDHKTRIKLFNYIYGEDTIGHKQRFVQSTLTALLVDGQQMLNAASEHVQDMESFSESMWNQRWSVQTKLLKSISPGIKSKQVKVQGPSHHVTTPALPLVPDVNVHDALPTWSDDIDIVGGDGGDVEPTTPNAQATVQQQHTEVINDAAPSALQASLQQQLVDNYLSMRVVIDNVVQCMGQRHYTFQYKSSYQGYHFMVLPVVNHDLTVQASQLYMVAAYTSPEGEVIPFTSNVGGYQQWCIDLNNKSPQRVQHKHYLLNVAHAVWDWMYYGKGGTVQSEQLSENGILSYMFREGRGEAFVVHAPRVYGYSIPVLYTATARDVYVSTTSKGVVKSGKHNFMVQCPLQDCRDTPGNCIHVTEIMSIGGWRNSTHHDFSHLSKALVDQDGIRRLRCHNTRLPPLRLPGSIEGMLYCKQSKSFILRTQQQCEHCGNDSVQPHGKAQEGLLYTRDVVCQFRFVGQYTCTSPKCKSRGKIQQYTGYDIGAFRYAYNINVESRGGISTFVEAVLLHDMMVQTTTTTTTMVQFWQNVVTMKYGEKAFYQLQDFVTSPVYPTLQAAFMYAVRQRLNRNMYDFAQIYLDSKDLGAVFGCKKFEACVKGPSMLVFDGSSYGYPAHYDGMHSKPPSHECTTWVHCIPYDKRCLTYGIKATNIKLLQRLLSPLYVDKQNQFVSKSVEQVAQYEELLSQMQAKPHWRLVTEAMTQLYESQGTIETDTPYTALGSKRQFQEGGDSQEQVTVAVMRFNWAGPYLAALRRCMLMVSCRAAKPMLIRVPVLQSMGISTYSVAAYNTDASMHDPLLQIQKHPNSLTTMQDFNPELLQLYQSTNVSVQWQRETTNMWFKWCIHQVCQFYDDVVNQADCSNAVLDVSDSVPLHKRHDVCYWADCEPLRYDRQYVVGPTPKVKVHDDKKDHDGDRACSKYPYYTRALTQGLLLVLCGHCGGCLGYEVMHGGESPRMPFFWTTRHRRKAPEYIIYDNACNLANYALMREPRFFERTRFLVDNFHQYSHHNCAPCHNANHYREVQGINTQLVEQFWRSLRLNKSTLAFMNKVNYSVMVRIGIYLVLKSRIARQAFEKKAGDGESVESLLKSNVKQDTQSAVVQSYMLEGHSIANSVQAIMEQENIVLEGNLGQEVVEVQGVDVEEEVDWGQGETPAFDKGIQNEQVIKCSA